MSIIADTKCRSNELVSHTKKVISDMAEAGEEVSFASVARRAQVSRSFLYSHDGIRDMIESCRLTKMTKTELRQELIKLKFKSKS